MPSAYKNILVAIARNARIIQVVDTDKPRLGNQGLEMEMNAIEKFAAATNNELFNGEWMVEAVETHETLEQFEASSAGWNERTAMQSGEIGGFPFRSWKRAQAVAGQPRQSMSVVDLGDIRIALPGTDLANF